MNTATVTPVAATARTLSGAAILKAVKDAGIEYVISGA